MSNGFHTSLDRKIEAAKRRAEEEKKHATPSKEPTQELTSKASTAENNVPNPKGKP